MRFIYVMDPMCSWCYGFQPELEDFIRKQPSSRVDWVMGGLAPDSDQAMDEGMKHAISSYWHQIEEKTRVSFNHDFWHLNTPRRSTYPACRAVIAAESLLENSAQDMVKAIQSAYYLDAKNPSIGDTLVRCAVKIGFNEDRFMEAFKSEETKQIFRDHLSLCLQLKVNGFPALFYIDDNNSVIPMTYGFCRVTDLEKRFDSRLIN